MTKRYSLLDKGKACLRNLESDKIFEEMEKIYCWEEEEARKQEVHILFPEILNQAREILSSYHQQKITLTTANAFEPRKAKRSASAVLNYLVNGKEQKTYLKEMDLSQPMKSTLQGHAYGRNQSNYFREKIFLEHFQAWGCGTPEYRGSFVIGEKGYLLQRFYEGVNLQRYVSSLLPQDKYFGLLILTAGALAAFNAHATLNAPALQEKLQQNSVEMMSTTFDSFLRKWASELSALHGWEEEINERHRKKIITILADAPKYALHRDFRPWNVLYCREQGLEDRLIIFDLEAVSLPSPSGTSGGPLAYDLGTLLIWPFIHGRKITTADKELIINRYISIFNQEMETKPGYKITNFLDFHRQIDAATLMAWEWWRGAEMRHQPLLRKGYGTCLNLEEKLLLQSLREEFE